MTKLKVGDILYDYSLKEYTVSKIGRQYAHLEGTRGYKVDMNTMRMKLYNGEMELFADKQSVVDKKEHSELSSKMDQFFRWSSRNEVTLDQLRRISEIISENKQ